MKLFVNLRKNKKGGENEFVVGFRRLMSFMAEDLEVDGDVLKVDDVVVPVYLSVDPYIVPITSRGNRSLLIEPIPI